MWKIAVGFVLFAALALFVLSKGGDIDMGGEKHGDMGHAEAPAHAPVAAVSAPTAAPASAAGVAPVAHASAPLPVSAPY
jgi:hypothetical protein